MVNVFTVDLQPASILCQTRFGHNLLQSSRMEADPELKNSSIL